MEGKRWLTLIVVVAEEVGRSGLLSRESHQDSLMNQFMM